MEQSYDASGYATTALSVTTTRNHRVNDSTFRVRMRLVHSILFQSIPPFHSIVPVHRIQTSLAALLDYMRCVLSIVSRISDAILSYSQLSDDLLPNLHF